jgi:hypothetical protein
MFLAIAVAMLRLTLSAHESLPTRVGHPSHLLDPGDRRDPRPIVGTTEDDIRQWRATLKTPTPSTAGTTVAEHARSAADAGYPSWRAAVERTRTLTLEEAATTLGVDTDDLRRARNAGGAAAVREREHAARRAGHPSWADAIDATIALTVDQAARALGVTTDRIRTWRRILVGPADAVRRNAAAVGAGYMSWDDALARTSGLPAARAAAVQGVDASTVRRWRGPRRDDRTVRRERRAHEAGHASWAEAIRATATCPPPERPGNWAVRSDRSRCGVPNSSPGQARTRPGRKGGEGVRAHREAARTRAERSRAAGREQDGPGPGRQP